MVHIGAVLVCGAAMAATFFVVGLPIASRLSQKPLAWFLAPALGWACFSVLTLIIFAAIGMSRPVVIAATALFVGGAGAIIYRDIRSGTFTPPPRHFFLLALCAAILALVPMAAILPKEAADGVTLSGPIFDHSKIALVDEIIRSGVPAQNPFFGEAGAPARVSYYYLWHFSAGAMALVTGASGWAADAALTWFTAFATLSMMAGLAVWVGGRTLAGFLVIALASTSSMRAIVDQAIGGETARGLVGWATGFGGWMFQVSWAPQHVASAMCVVMACYLISQLPQRNGPLPPLGLAIVVAAGFQSSVWVGGIVFFAAASVIGVAVLCKLERADRLPFMIRAAVAAAIAGVIVAPFLYEQIAANALRGGAFPIAVEPLQVLGETVPATFRRFLDLPAYWLVFLPLEFPAFYPVGMVALFMLLRDRSMPDGRRGASQILAILVAVSLVAAWMLVSVVGDNNDLGWRAVLPAVLLLIPFAAAALAQWMASSARLAAALGLGAAIVGLPGGILQIGSNLSGEPSSSGRIFAGTPAMWEAVRRHSGPGERVANNPYFLRDLTSWPVNISWALLADRRSCYAGWELAIPFAPISVSRRTEIDALFVRIFEGRSGPGDVEQFHERFRCDVIVVTAQDGAWARDPFASGERYRLVDSKPNAWRIYRRTAKQGG